MDMFCGLGSRVIRNHSGVLSLIKGRADIVAHAAINRNIRPQARDIFATADRIQTVAGRTDNRTARLNPNGRQWPVETVALGFQGGHNRLHKSFWW